MNNVVLVDSQIIAGRWDKRKKFKANALEMFRLAMGGHQLLGPFTIAHQFAVAAAAIARNVKGKDLKWLKEQARNVRKMNAFLEAAQEGLAPEPPELGEEHKRDYTLMDLSRKANAQLKKEGVTLARA